MNRLIVQVLYVCLGLVCLTHASRHRHNELGQPLGQSLLHQSAQPKELWNLNGTYIFPLADFPSLDSGIGLNLGGKSVNTLQSINLHTGNIDWSINWNVPEWSSVDPNPIVSPNYDGLFYLNIYQDDGCFQLAAFTIRSSTPKWVHNGGCNLWGFFAYSIDGRDLVLRFDVKDNSTVTAIDGSTGKVLYQKVIMSSMLQFTQRGSVNNPLLVTSSGVITVATIYSVSTVGLKIVNTYQADQEWNQIYWSQHRGLVSVQQWSRNHSHPTYRGVDLLTNRTLWMSNTTNNPILTGSWVQQYSNYTMLPTFPYFQVNPVNPEQMILISTAFNRNGDGSYLIMTAMLDARAGGLSAATVIGPLTGKHIAQVVNDKPWLFVDNNNNLVLSFMLGPDISNLSWYWYGYTQNLSSIGFGVVPPSEDNESICGFVDVTATSGTLIYSTQANGLRAVKYDVSGDSFASA